MEAVLAKVSQQAMNYAIRSGITITSTYALGQLSKWLKSAPKNLRQDTRDHLIRLRLRLETKMKIISPAIDMIELIAARGNTSLESAVALTTAIRRDMNSLAQQVSELMDYHARTPSGDSKTKTPLEVEADAQRITKEIEALLFRIEDAVPLINLAITTSGVKLSTSLPPTVSPSRLLQASTFLTAGDSQYTLGHGDAAQVGPVFTLTMFMLFGAHRRRQHDAENVREMTWKEVMHKARVKLMRVPLDQLAPSGDDLHSPYHNHRRLPAENHASEFAYQLVIVEDLDDDRVHSFSDDDEQPSPFEDVMLAGLRELIPIHQISKIFYADTGKILNIGSDSSVNQPVLLLKRDINAPLPRQLADIGSGEEDEWDDRSDDGSHPPSPTSSPQALKSTDGDESDEDPSAQLLREASLAVQEPSLVKKPSKWKLPSDLDPEWIAFEVYVPNDLSESDDEEQISDTGNESEDRTPSRVDPRLPPAESRASINPSYLVSTFSRLSLGPTSLSSYQAPVPRSHQSSNKSVGGESAHSRTGSQDQSLMLSQYDGRQVSALPALRTSLSLLELLMRLTSLQQFTQTSHLSTPDELLNFFLSESSTVGAGSDANLRQRARRAARQKVGFDPYDESPVKFRTEDGIQQHAEHGSYVDNGEGAYSPSETPRSSPAPTLVSGYGSRRSSPYVHSPLARGWMPRSTPQPRGPVFHPFPPAPHNGHNGTSTSRGTGKSPLRPTFSAPTSRSDVDPSERHAGQGSEPGKKPPSPEPNAPVARPGTPPVPIEPRIQTPSKAHLTDSPPDPDQAFDSGDLPGPDGRPPATPPSRSMTIEQAALVSPSYPVPSIERQ